MSVLVSGTGAGIDHALIGPINTTGCRTLLFGVNLWHFNGVPVSMTDSEGNVYTFLAEKLSPEWLLLFYCQDPITSTTHSFDAWGSGPFRRPSAFVIGLSDVINTTPVQQESGGTNDPTIEVGDSSAVPSPTLQITCLGVETITDPSEDGSIGQTDNGFDVICQVGTTTAGGVGAHTGVNAALKYVDAPGELNIVEWTTDPPFNSGIGALLLTLTITVPPINEFSGIYKFVPSKTSDTLYIDAEDGTTQVRKIP